MKLNRILIIVILFIMAGKVYPSPSITFPSLKFPLKTEDCYINKNKIVLTGWYYYKRDDCKGYYKALNIPCKKDSNVYSCSDGRVVDTGWDYIEGVNIEVSMECGLTIRYSHLKDWCVIKGSTVKTGDMIGVAGFTGRTSGKTHLRLVAINNDKDVYITDRFKERFHCVGNGKIDGISEY